MPIYISRGRFTSDAVKGMVAKPENREEAVSKLFESMSYMNLSALSRLARSQGCTTSWRLTAARLKKRTGDLPTRESPPMTGTK
jgi:hypothetical protein